MRIGFDAKRAAQNRTGLGNYSRFTLSILSQDSDDGNEYHLYIPNRRRMPFLKEIPTLRKLRLHFPETSLWRHLRSLWRIWGVTADLRRDGIDLFHGLSNELPLNIRRAGCKSVVTIHDLIFLRHPEYYKPIDRLIYNYKFQRACQQADRIIAVSEFTKRDIIHYYNVDAEKIDVVYQGCDPAFAKEIPHDVLTDIRRRYSLPERFVLYVGSIEERKNARMIVLAAEKAANEGHPFDAVFVGKDTKYCERLKQELSTMNCAARCHFFHSVPYADLPSFYRLATLFVYPSIVEGFGIPLLEAITAGVPAIGCTGSCLEEAGGSSSVYLSPHDYAALERTITSLLNNERKRNEMIAAGHTYAQRFTPQRLRHDLVAVYGRVLTAWNTC